MTTRRRALTWSAWLPLCLVTGCVLSTGGRSTSVVQDPVPPAPPAAEASPSPYGLRVTPASRSDRGGGPGVALPGTPDGALLAPPSYLPQPLPLAEPSGLPGTAGFTPAATAPAPEAPPQIVTGRSAAPAEPDLVSSLRSLLQEKQPPTRALTLLLEGKLDQANPEDLACALRDLNQLTARLRQRVPLILDKLCYCRGVEAFGAYDPFPADHGFQAGVGGKPGERVQVYVEVRNFTSRPCNDGYETCLDSTLEIRDARNVVWRMDFPASPDRSQTPRQDFFLAYRFHVPPRMPPGRYDLWVIVREKTGEPGHGDREARKSIPFRVDPDGARPLPRMASMP
jgi:hypothetical protein